MALPFFVDVLRQLRGVELVSLSFGGESALHPQLPLMATLTEATLGISPRVYSNGDHQYPQNVEVIVNPKPPQPIITSDFQLENNKLPIKNSFCEQLYNYCAILWNGDVTRCCADIGGAKVIGNLHKQSLFEVWNGPVYKVLRRRGYCLGCEVYKYK
jgi:hypothetical protein